MPGASELSTVEWHSAHVTPKRVMVLVASTVACTPTTAFRLSNTTVVAGSSRFACPALSWETSPAGSASTSTFRPTPSAVLGLIPWTTWCIFRVSVQKASSPKVSNRKTALPSVSTSSIGDVTSFSDVQAAIAASHPISSQRCLMPHLARERGSKRYSIISRRLLNYGDAAEEDLGCGGADAGSGRKPAFQIGGAERPRLSDERAGMLHLAPGIPQEHAAHPPRLQVVNDSLTKQGLPVSDGFEARVELPHGFVAELEQVRVEERQVRVRRRSAGHVLPGDLAHGVGVVFVLHPEAGAEGAVGEAGDVSRGVHVRMAGAAELVDDDAVLHQQSGLLRELDARLDAQAGHDDVADDLGSRRGAHDALAAARLQPDHPFARAQLDALFPIVIDEEARQIRREDARAQPCLRHQHHDVTALQPQRRRDLTPDEPAPHDREAEPLFGEAAQAAVVVQRAEVDHLVRLQRQAPRRAAGGEQQLLEPVHRAPVVGDAVSPQIDADHTAAELQIRAGRRRLAPDALLRLSLPQALRERRAVVGGGGGPGGPRRAAGRGRGSAARFSPLPAPRRAP